MRQPPQFVGSAGSVVAMMGGDRAAKKKRRDHRRFLAIPCGDGLFLLACLAARENSLLRTFGSGCPTCLLGSSQATAGGRLDALNYKGLLTALGSGLTRGPEPSSGTRFEAGLGAGTAPP